MIEMGWESQQEASKGGLKLAYILEVDKCIADANLSVTKHWRQLEYRYILAVVGEVWRRLALLN